MKCIKYIIIVTVFCSMTGLMAMQRDFSTSGKDVVILVPQSDEVGFIVDVDLAKSSKTLSDLIEDAGIDNPIPLPNVAPKVLERLLRLLDKGILSEELSLDDFVNLLRAEDYLDMKEARQPLLNGIGNALSCDQAVLALAFSVPMSSEGEDYLVKRLLKKAERCWNEKFLRELLANQEVPRHITLKILKELIRSQEVLLVQIVPAWNIHLSRCKELGAEDSMMCGLRIENPQ